MELVIVDYHMGNLQSVANAFEALGCPTHLSRNPEDLRQARRIVLPGVGAFGDGMRHLTEGGWVDVLEEEVRRRGKPFLGICLGMQLLATTGTEYGLHQGLNWLPGVAERLPSDDQAIRVPHIGWNDVRIIKKGGIYTGMGDTQVFYFVHSYVLRPNDFGSVSGLCCHGVEFAASIEFDNIYATQYHPEKSQKAGLTILRNFLSLKS